MSDIEEVWERIRRHSGEEFQTIKGLAFTYETPGNFLRVSREGREINRSLSRTNFARALDMLPASGPGKLPGRQGASYTWAILMDGRIRKNDW